jgi:histidinol dehydrogenase
MQQISLNDALQTRRLSSLDDILPDASKIVEDVRTRGDAALMEYSIRFGDLQVGDSFIITREELQQAVQNLDKSDREVLERTAGRIKRFAEAQRESLHDISLSIEGGRAGHTIFPLDSAACYAPGGRYPLPSSVLMTAVTARAAGVRSVWVISPRPSVHTLAAAAIAGADALLCVGGAQAIAAAAFGTKSVPAFDIIVGPGNRWVTAAKQLVSGHVKIDMLAGPSELVVVADESANPAVVAADLLAQAEHDPDARVVLISFGQEPIDNVNRELTRQLPLLPTKEIATQSLSHGFAVNVAGLEEASRLCNALAPEHLSLQLADTSAIRKHLRNYGGLFIGHTSAEAFGDYGAGPNHVLPTEGSARLRGGLSVFDFLSVRTWLEMEDSNQFSTATNDMITLARMEGLEAHARSLTARIMS